MKKMLNTISVMICLLVFTSSIFAENIREVKIKTNAHCGNCKNKIESVIGKLDGVKSVNVEMKDKVATISFDDEKIKDENLKSSIIEAGYKADILKSSNSQKKENKTIKDGKKGTLNVIK